MYLLLKNRAGGTGCFKEESLVRPSKLLATCWVSDYFIAGNCWCIYRIENCRQQGCPDTYYSPNDADNGSLRHVNERVDEDAPGIDSMPQEKPLRQRVK